MKSPFIPIVALSLLLPAVPAVVARDLPAISSGAYKYRSKVKDGTGYISENNLGRVRFSQRKSQIAISVTCSNYRMFLLFKRNGRYAFECKALSAKAGDIRRAGSWKTRKNGSVVATSGNAGLKTQEIFYFPLAGHRNPSAWLTIDRTDDVSHVVRRERIFARWLHRD
ncbi:MAG TPA: hypothetical protein VIM61_01750 [Chthoniobacterales bacterium]